MHGRRRIAIGCRSPGGFNYVLVQNISSAVASGGGTFASRMRVVIFAGLGRGVVEGGSRVQRVKAVWRDGHGARRGLGANFGSDCVSNGTEGGMLGHSYIGHPSLSLRRGPY